MKLLIHAGRVLDPSSGLDQVCDLALNQGRVLAIQNIPADFKPEQRLDARGCVVAPGLVDLGARLAEPGHQHGGMLESELQAAAAGGVTSVVFPPDTDPVLDEPGLVEMLKLRADKLQQTRVLPLGALTRGLAGEALADMVELAQAGCVGFGQADRAVANTLVLMRALQYASTFGYTVWLRPQDWHLGQGVAASGALATRLGLSGVPVAAETIALHTVFELMRATGARVHLCRLSSAAGVDLVRQAKQQGLPLSCDVSVNSLHLSDLDIGFFDSRMRLNPPLRQQRDREALAQGLLDGTIDALISDHAPVKDDEKTLPFAEAEPGATGLELLLGLALRWAQDSGASLTRTVQVLTSGPAQVLGDALPAGSGIGRLQVGGVADLCIFDPQASYTVVPQNLLSQGKHTPFAGWELPGRVRYTLVGGRVVYRADARP